MDLYARVDRMKEASRKAGKHWTTAIGPQDVPRAAASSRRGSEIAHDFPDTRFAGVVVSTVQLREGLIVVSLPISGRSPPWRSRSGSPLAEWADFFRSRSPSPSAPVVVVLEDNFLPPAIDVQQLAKRGISFARAHPDQANVTGVEARTQAFIRHFDERSRQHDATKGWTPA